MVHAQTVVWLDIMWTSVNVLNATRTVIPAVYWVIVVLVATLTIGYPNQTHVSNAIPLVFNVLIQVVMDVLVVNLTIITHKLTEHAQTVV